VDITRIFILFFNFLKKSTLSLGLVAFLNHLLNNELKICEKYEAEVFENFRKYCRLQYE